MKEKGEIKLVVFDLDGTIYNGNQIIEGALETINFIKNKGIDVCYFTNNSSYSRTQICKKLKDFSIDLNEEDVYCCTYAAKIYIEKYEYKKIYVIGSNELVEEVLKSKALVTQCKEEQDVDALLIGMDTNFTYRKLADAFEVIQRNSEIKILVCNMDYSFPAENGLRKPGCGAIASSILIASSRNIDFHIGKPNSFILDLIAIEKKVLHNYMLVVGDSYESDIQMAINSNVKSVLIDNSTSEKYFNTKTVDSISNFQQIFDEL